MAVMTTGSGRSWYVLSDTNAQIVNIVPAVVIGLDRIDNVLTLRGVTAGQLSAATDHHHGGRTHAWLRAAIESECRARQIKGPAAYTTIEGDKDDPAAWRRLLLEHFARQSNVGHIVFVYTGGTKDMALGAWSGIEAVKATLHPSVQIELVAKQVSRVFWPGQAAGSVPLLDGGNRLSLESYLRLHGFDEVQAEQSAASEATALARRSITLRLAALVFEGDNEPLIASRGLFLNRMKEQGRTDLDHILAGVADDVARDQAKYQTQGIGGESAIAALQQRLRPALVAGLRAFLSELAMVVGEIDGVELHLNSRGAVTEISRLEAGKYLARGGWFEEWMWLRARDAMQGTQAVARLNLKLQDCDVAEHGQGAIEIDVAVMLHDELHLIECKTDKRERDKSEQLQKLQSRKTELSSVFGMAWLANAPPLFGVEAAYRVASRAQVGLASGPRDIEKMLSAFRNLVPGPTRNG